MKNAFVLSGMRWSKNNWIDQSAAGWTARELVGQRKGRIKEEYRGWYRGRKLEREKKEEMNKHSLIIFLKETSRKWRNLSVISQWHRLNKNFLKILCLGSTTYENLIPAHCCFSNSPEGHSEGWNDDVAPSWPPTHRSKALPTVLCAE